MDRVTDIDITRQNIINCDIFTDKLSILKLKLYLFLLQLHRKFSKFVDLFDKTQMWRLVDVWWRKPEYSRKTTDHVWATTTRFMSALGIKPQLQQ